MRTPGALPTVALMTLAFSNTVVGAEDYEFNPHPYSQISALNGPTQSARDLLGDDFKEWIIKDTSGEQIARFISLESSGSEGDSGYIDQVVLNPGSSGPKTFSDLISRYESEHSGTRVVSAVAGAFTCDLQKGECPTASVNHSSKGVDTYLLHDGESVGWENLRTMYGGVFEFGPETTLRITSGAEHKRTMNSGGAVSEAFQGFRPVVEGVSQSLVSQRTTPVKENTRAFVQRDFIDNRGQRHTTWGIIQTEGEHGEMTFDEFGEFLSNYGVRNAFLLDTGGWARGVVVLEDGQHAPLLNPDLNQDISYYTSVLLAVSRD